VAMSIRPTKIIRRVRSKAWAIASYLRGLREFWRDAHRHLRRSSPSGADRLPGIKGKHLEGQLTKDYHRIEKALSLARPRRPFGLELQGRLTTLVGGPPASTQRPEVIKYTQEALAALDEWNGNGQINDWISPRMDSCGATASDSAQEGSTLTLFEQRRSVRNFNPDLKVEAALVGKAVALAGLTPSVCNRQPWRAYAFTQREDVVRILKHHSGSAGFGDEASGVLIVTVDLRLFSGAGERNQRWIDGGLFAMSLVLALQQLGISTCMLNWSRDNASSMRLRNEARIQDDEDIVVLIAYGYPREGYRVARSPRRSLEELLTIR
jgi:nitroreductase